jgi:hypothetical protein
MSLDWARHLLYPAGADRVILVSFGKYGRNHPLLHDFYTPPAAQPGQPFQLNNYANGAEERALPSDHALMDLTEPWTFAGTFRQTFHVAVSAVSLSRW